MLAAILTAAFLASPAAARELAGLSFGNSENVPVAAQDREVKAQAPDFFFYTGRTNEIVTMRDGPEFRRRVQEEAAGLPQPLTVRVLAGKPVLVYFWGAAALPGPGGRSVQFCPACPATMALMDELYRKYASQGLQVVGVAVQASEGELKRAWETYGHRVGAPKAESPAHAMGLHKLPSWALIDRGGSIVAASDQPADPTYLAAKIGELLAP